ncbi:hypothetical protein DSM112329_03803 [Paraconexibacter sp. AEG42_29]|uniref:Uncharacterized protein n=1 Tax=Paraconexibacter sp. AEG42_29 TaxID=2997339 RepID=A0AAU7AYX5_9ACTN
MAGTVAVACTALAAAPAPAHALCSVSLLSPCLQLSMPASPLALGTVSAGTTTVTAQQALTVSSNVAYGVKVSTDLVDGRPKEWTGAAYVVAAPKILANALEVARTSYDGTPTTPVWRALNSTPYLLGTGLGPTGCLIGLLCGTHDLGVRYRLRSSFSDRRASPNSYRIQVTYTADHAF